MDFAPKGVVAARLRAARLGLGLSQQQVAAEIGVGQPAVYAWESALYLPRRELWAAVARTLETTVESVFYIQRRRVG